MNKKFSRGFTLIELSIVVFMTALLASVMLANFRQAEKLKRVTLTVDSATNIVRLGQSYTLSGKQIQRATGCSGDNSALYYHLVFMGDATSIPLYADDKCAASVLVDQYNFLEQVHIVPNSIRVEVCSPGCATTTANSLNIRFTPPFGGMTFSRDGVIYNKFSKAEIDFTSADGSKTRTMQLDGVSGRIGN